MTGLHVGPELDFRGHKWFELTDRKLHHYTQASLQLSKTHYTVHSTLTRLYLISQLSQSANQLISPENTWTCQRLLPSNLNSIRPYRFSVWCFMSNSVSRCIIIFFNVFCHYGLPTMNLCVLYIRRPAVITLTLFVLSPSTDHSVSNIISSSYPTCCLLADMLVNMETKQANDPRQNTLCSTFNMEMTAWLSSRWKFYFITALPPRLRADITTFH